MPVPGIRSVSIPRRYAKNPKVDQPSWQSSPVSIPRRYAKNAFYTLPGSRSVFLFQSLVGTLKTDIQNDNSRYGAGFQSLVGTLKTLIACQFSAIAPVMFQSLVGTLKTTYCAVLPLLLPSFQSLVGTLKTAYPEALATDFIGFNPS